MVIMDPLIVIIINKYTYRITGLANTLTCTSIVSLGIALDETNQIVR
jgi:hypothetical protein